MKLNFFKQGCDHELDDIRFGIIDPRPAEVSLGPESEWLATVENPNRRRIHFIAADKCIPLRNEKNQEISLCEAILAYGHDLDFVELKTGDKNWYESGLHQIESTVRHFFNYHDIRQFGRIRGFVSHRRRPEFNASSSATAKRLWMEYRMVAFSKHVITVV